MLVMSNIVCNKEHCYQSNHNIDQYSVHFYNCPKNSLYNYSYDLIFYLTWEVNKAFNLIHKETKIYRLDILWLDSKFYILLRCL